jgi:hypothetical protein
MNNRHLDANNRFFVGPVYSCVLLGFLGFCFVGGGVLESDWGLFTPHLSPQMKESFLEVFQPSKVLHSFFLL